MCTCVCSCVKCVYYCTHLIRIGELELPAVARPRDEPLAALVSQQLKQELPQLDGP